MPITNRNEGRNVSLAFFSCIPYKQYNLIHLTNPIIHNPNPSDTRRSSTAKANCHETPSVST